jgi:hypothetical protein
MLAEILSGFMLIITPVMLMAVVGFLMWCLFRLIKEIVS